MQQSMWADLLAEAHDGGRRGDGGVAERDGSRG